MMTATVPRHVGRDARNWHEASVTARLAGERYLLDDNRAAQRALSCLVVPETGDRVLCWSDGDGEHFIVQVLSRQDARRVCLNAGRVDELALSATRLTLHADNQLDLLSLHDLALHAGAGRLSLAARHVDLAALETLIQNARQFVGRCEHWLQEAEGLARLHGGQTLVDADEDVRVDAERISMG